MRASRTLGLSAPLIVLLLASPNRALAAGGWFDNAGCYLLNVYDVPLYPSANISSIVVSSPASKDTAAPVSAAVESLNQAFREALTKELVDSKFFSSVTAASQGESARGDYLLEAGILGVTRRNYTGRVFGGGDGMRIGGTFRGPATAEAGGRPLIADWECLGVSSGGWAFLGTELGPGAGNNERAAANNIRRIADALARTLTDKDVKKELADKVGYQSKAASQSPLRGGTKNQRRGWREKADWDASDFTDEIASFVASSERKDRRGVDAVWVTNSVFQTNQKLLPLLDQSDGLIRKWGFGGENRLQVGAGTMLDLGPLERVRGKDLYVLALTFNTALSETPHLWRADDVRSSLTISRGDRSAVAVAPLEVLQGPPDPYALGLVHVQRGFANSELRCAALHPVIAVFPTSFPDGSPLIKGVGDVLELNTVMDGRKVILTFNLAHLDLKSVDDLKIQ